MPEPNLPELQANTVIGDYNPEDYPVTITLRFQSVEAKNKFMGGLSDGFGENYCGIAWDLTLDKSWYGDPYKANYSFKMADTFLIEPFEDEDEEEQGEQ